MAISAASSKSSTSTGTGGRLGSIESLLNEPKPQKDIPSIIETVEAQMKLHNCLKA